MLIKYFDIKNIIQRHNFFQSFASIGRVDLVFSVFDQTPTHFFGRPDGKVFLTVVPILPWFLVSILLWMIFTREAGRGCGRLLDPLSDFLRFVAETLDYYPHLFAQNLLLFRAKYCGNFTCHRTEKGQNVNSAQQICR